MRNTDKVRTTTRQILSAEGTGAIATILLDNTFHDWSQQTDGVRNWGVFAESSI